MKLYPILTLAACLFFLACSKSKVIPANEDAAALHERFHGKYKVISSVSSEAVDVNADGISGINLLEEIPDLKYADVLLLINPGQEFTFAQSWPEQYLSPGKEPTGYDPNLAVNYAKQGVSGSFVFDAAIKKITITSAIDEQTDTARFYYPDKITIEAGDHINVLTHKRLYTKAGWKKVNIVTVYERYTKTT